MTQVRDITSPDSRPRSAGAKTASAAPQPPLEAAASEAVTLLMPVVQAGQTGQVPGEAATERLRAGTDALREVGPAEAYAVLTPALCGKHPHVAMQWLRDTGALLALLPELDATVSFSQEGGRRHKDVWEHTKAVVWQAVPRPAVRWAAALHDIGKVPTRRFLPGGKTTFHGHAEEGARMFRRGAARRIAFPEGEQRTVELLIRYHLRGGQYDGSWTDAAVRRFAREMGPLLTDLLDLSRADVTSRRPGKRRRCLYLISELSRRIRTLEAEDARPKPLPPGLGNLLMKALELPPGKHIGELRERLVTLHAAHDIEGGREADYYLEIVRTRGLLDGIQIRPPRGFAAKVSGQAADAGDP